MLYYSVVLLAAVAVSVGATKNLRSDKVTEQAYGGTFAVSQEEFVLFNKKSGTKDLSEEEMYEVEQKLASMSFYEEMDAEIESKLTIDVYFHIIAHTSNEGTLTQQEVEAQMDVLNKDFKKTKLKFILKDTTTTTNNNWFKAGRTTTNEVEMKEFLRMGDASTLNIYSNAAYNNEFLSWATFPSSLHSDSLTEDGVVIDYRTLPGGKFKPYNEGRVLTHEVGHWLGLYDTFQGGCNMNSNEGDRVEDTPAVASANFGCPSDDTDSCPGNTDQLLGNDLVHNFMDHVYDACMWEFTKGQIARIHMMWRAYRT